MWQRLKRWAKALKKDGLTLWFCCRHPGMPWLPKLFALLVVGYFLSPIDLIPDFIPVLGYLDDLILLPVFIYIILKLVPVPVLTDSRAKAAKWIEEHRAIPKSITTAVIITVLWLLFFAALWHFFGDQLINFFSPT